MPTLVGDLEKPKDHKCIGLMTKMQRIKWEAGEATSIKQAVNCLGNIMDPRCSDESLRLNKTPKCQTDTYNLNIPK